MDNMVRLIRKLILGTALIYCAGCAAKWTDKDGNTHILGLANIKITPTKERRLAGDIVEVETVGASWLSDDRVGSLALGYNRTTTASFMDNAVAKGPFDRVKADDK